LLIPSVTPSLVVDFNFVIFPKSSSGVPLLGKIRKNSENKDFFFFHMKQRKLFGFYQNLTKILLNYPFGDSEIFLPFTKIL
jgi:hypothetical protein